jgi:molybdenum cofactor cytidylyltransferase
VVLAAGLSRRMGGSNKLLAPLDGEPMIARVVDAFLASKARPVLVVVGHQADRVRAALAGRDVRFVENAAYEEGLGASLRAGIEALGEDVDAALVGLGDMPRITPAHVNRIVDAFDPAGPETIVVPVHDRKRGHPVLWSARHFAEMRKLGGDVGARGLLERHADAVRTVAIDDDAVHIDVDTPEMLAGAAGANTLSKG